MSVMTINWALAIVALGAFTVVNGTVLNKCYSCSSSGACDDAVDTARLGICHFNSLISSELNDTNRICYKIVYAENGTIATLRGCALKSSKYYSDDGKSEIEFCNRNFTNEHSTRSLTSCNTCENELCNSSYAIGASVTIVILSIFSLFLL
ncbi:uncharacterized protein LOC126750538 isoform X2 [Anthonomus grandis grandis]|uniref:uncharacterized protein LOC126750538 isoform X2 n=1 Tax=Anthonomus grandis grandis TaxID=2921223 RepID=UPI002165ED50|nr:uncharacterized protein LOC126750538 isoform X2 [Anthonomus grandis grandis]